MLLTTDAFIFYRKAVEESFGADVDYAQLTKLFGDYGQYGNERHQHRALVHPRLIISVPSEITQVERRAVTDSAYRAKAAEVHLVDTWRAMCARSQHG